MHNIHYLIFDENVDKRKIMAEICEIASSDGDGYSSSLKWHNIEPLKNYEDAK